MAAKAVVIVATGLVIGAVATVFSYAIGNAVLTSRGLDITLDGGTQTQALVGSTLLFALYGLIGLGVGAIIRAPAGAITFLVVWPIVVENIISAFFPEVGRWLPFTAGIQLISTSETVDATEAMSPAPAGSGSPWSVSRSWRSVRSASPGATRSSPPSAPAAPAGRAAGCGSADRTVPAIPGG